MIYIKRTHTIFIKPASSCRCKEAHLTVASVYICVHVHKDTRLQYSPVSYHRKNLLPYVYQHTHSYPAPKRLLILPHLSRITKGAQSAMGTRSIAGESLTILNSPF